MTDLHKASAFLEALGGGSFVFQTFTDQKGAVPKGQRDPLATVLIGSFEEHKDRLAKLNNDGAGVFVQINEGSKRGKDHVTKVRAIFVDLDEPTTAKQSLAAVKQWLPKPSIITQSSKCKYHIYWTCEGLAVDEFTKVQKALAFKFGGDEAMGNKDRVMRLPGFMHKKGDAQLVSSSIFNLTYNAGEVVDAIATATCLVELPDAPVKRKAKASTDCFGLDIGDGYEVPEEIGKGGRVNELVRHVGKLISEGWGVEEVLKRLLAFNQSKCNPPVDKSRLEREVLPSIHNFWATRQASLGLSTPAVPPRPLAATTSVPPPPPVAATPAVPAPPVSATTAVPAPPVSATTTTETVKEEPIEDADSPVGDGQEDFAPSVDLSKLERCTMKTAAEKNLSNEVANLELYKLESWNKRFVWIKAQSRVGDRAARGPNSVLAEKDFKGTMKHIVVDKSVLLTNWMTSKERIEVIDEFYYPDGQEFTFKSGNYFWNLHCPAEIQPVEECDEEKVQPFLDLINFLCPLESDREVLLNWMAFSYQKPAIRIPWAPLILSDPGAGKGLLYAVLRQVMGTGNCNMIQHDRLDNSFNSFLYQSTLVVVDEMEASSKSSISKLKSYITETSLEINTKGVKETNREIYANIIIFTNKADAIPIEDKDRRFWVLKVEGVESQEFYNRVDTWKADAENIAHLMAFLRDRAIPNKWHNNRPAMNYAKASMIESTKSEFEKSFYDALNAREGAFAADITCFKSVKEYMTIRLDETLSTREVQQLSALLAKETKAAASWGTKALPLKVQGATFRQRPRCIRNLEQWSNQPRGILVHEMNRSHQMVNRTGPVDPPMLQIIKGDT